MNRPHESLAEALRGQKGRAFWRCLEEHAQSPEFERWLADEFPRGIGALPGGISRRRFLQLMAASMALAGVGGAGCNRAADERIVPYVRQPEHVVPGKPLFFATALTLGGYARGALVESHTGRPTKVEGNPQHPASLGATDLFMQAAPLTLYDPDRSQAVSTIGQITTWENFAGAIAAERQAMRANGGRGLRLLTRTITSPTATLQIARLLELFPEARWHQYDPVNHDAVYAGALAAFGEPVEPVHDLRQADVVVCLDDDLLNAGPASIRAAHDFMARRRDASQAMNRLYVAEVMPTPTGAVADHRLAARPTELGLIAQALAAAVGVALPWPAPELPERLRRWVAAAAADLREHAGASLVTAGPTAPVELHVLAHAINAHLNNVGATLRYIQPPAVNTESHEQSLRDLATDMAAGRVDTLLMLDANPVYDAPADLEFATYLDNVRLRIHVGLYHDETAFLSHWHVPLAHELESWGDARAFDGVATVIQPLIAPLYGGRTVHDVIGLLLDQPLRTSYEWVRRTWQDRLEGDFESAWRHAVHDGVIPGTASPVRNVRLMPDWASRITPTGPQRGAHLELSIRPDPTVHDGRFANNAWLQECPKPITTLTWDNAVMLSPATAQRLAVGNDDVVELMVEQRQVRGPVLVVPGHADDVVTVHLGYGRTRPGQVGRDAGFSAYRVRSNASPWFALGVQMTRTGRRHELALTQKHHLMEGRDHLRVIRAGQRTASGEAERRVPLSLYPDHDYSQQEQWGMVIDLGSCTGCNACVIACQAENNVPVVGRDEVLRAREMHWLRIDTYFEGEPTGPDVRVHAQPVLCMHCENAPCEVVCPVNATVHSADGLNEMVYNRCVGTRYCSNNCPYKVRRFNYFHYAQPRAPVQQMLMNPDVSVRIRGVMEKCTYCVQRIRNAVIEARKQGRLVVDGELETACQAACATRAIVFGNLNDPQSRVATLARLGHSYHLLDGLGTRPRTSYLAKITNPNPALDDG